MALARTVASSPADLDKTPDRDRNGETEGPALGAVADPGTWRCGQAPRSHGAPVIFTVGHLKS